MNLPPQKPSTQTLVDLLRLRGTSPLSQREGYTFLDADGQPSTTLTYADLDVQARQIAARFISEGRRGQRALILCSPGSAYLAALFGCFYAGVTAVTAYPPRARRRDDRLCGVIKDCQATFALVDRQLASRKHRLAGARDELANMEWLNVDAIGNSPAAAWAPPPCSADTLAVLQYTSGSTSQPRGVMLTHRNLLHNLEVIFQTFAFAPEEQTGVCWLPPYHDMGLIGGLLQPLYSGKSTYILSPAAFIQKPLRWLQAISDFGTQISGAPNFAYDLCVEKICDADRDRLDLRRWSLAFNGAEPILPQTLDRFCEKFGPCGFRREAFLPCYGLAEATLMVSGGPRGTAPPQRRFDGRPLVSCGAVSPLHTVRIVDPQTGLPCPPESEGEVWVASESVSRGYWRRDEESMTTFRGQLPGEAPHYLRTGDLGRLADGQLYITGRLKDLIVLRGRNLHPHELEAQLDRCHDASVVHGSAATMIQRPADGTAGLGIVHEIQRATPPDAYPAIVEAIRSVLAYEFDVTVDAVALIPAGRLPRTSSGKPRRSVARDLVFAAPDSAADSTPDSPTPDSPTPDAPTPDAPTPQAVGDCPAVHRWYASASPSRATGRQIDDAAPPFAPEPNGNGAPTVASEPASSPATDRHATAAVDIARIEEWLSRRIAAQMELPIERIRNDAPFAEFGLDSVSAVQIAGDLQDHLGRPLPATLFYDAPTIAEAARLVIESTQPDTLKQPTMTAPNRSHAPAGEDDIAIVGVACRLPGCDSPAAFWRLLLEGQDGTGPPPTGRHAAVDPRLSGSRAGWLRDIDRFDAELFQITPAEAEWIDPQHRLLLETSWRAFADAGLDPRRLEPTCCGVYVGISADDYARQIITAGLPWSPYSVTGNAASMAAHRISYHLHLRGPSLTVDTACSSSLVAVHQARRAIQAGDCDLALVGGVNLILRPDVSLALDQAGMLAADGHCKAFDAAADGYVRGEGCLAIVLKPLSAARRDGHPVYAVIAGSAINQDGRTNGITAPSGSAQTRLVRAALRDAGMTADQIGMIEAHGTGTSLGDPIEFNALREALDQTTGPQPPDCVVGSVKTNLGHLEAAAGLAGLLKSVLAVHHGVRPAMAHFHEPNPELALAGSRLKLAAQPTPWPAGRRVAGVSSFGFGGTNAHVLIAAPPAAPQTLPTTKTACSTAGRTHLFTLSAASNAALRRAADQLRHWLADAGAAARPADIARTLMLSRGSLPHRLAIVAADSHQLQQRLTQFLEGTRDDQLWTGIQPPGRAARIGMLFSGQGGQAVGMGRDLIAMVPPFRSWIERADARLREHQLPPVGPFLTDPPCRCGACDEAHCEAGGRRRRPESQTAQLALQLGLLDFLQSLGIQPHAVLGHSLGEYAAAVAAGVWQPDPALLLAARRAAAIDRLNAPGQMLVVLGPAAATRRLAVETGAEIAAENGPEQIVLAGDNDAITRASKQAKQQGLHVRNLPTAAAFHSRQLDPILPALREAVTKVAKHPPQATFVSTHSGQVESARLLDPEYWVQQTRQTVRFAQAATTAAAQTPCDLWIELGPQPTLADLLPMQAAADLPCVATLTPQARGLEALQATAAASYVAGVDFRPTAADCLCGPGQRLAGLPGYPFESQRHWLPGLASLDAEVAVTDAVRQPAVAADSGSPAADELAPLQAYVRLLPTVDRIVAVAFLSALTRLGWAPKSGDAVIPDDLAKQLQIESSYTRLLNRMLQVFGEEGWLVDDRAGFTVDARLADARRLHPDAMIDGLLRDHPSTELEMRMLRRCAEALPQVLTGREAPLAVLMPGGDFQDLEALYGQSPMARRSNHLVAQHIVDAAQKTKSPLRILEVGAGTGGTSSGVLKALRDAAAGYEYTFTDTSPVFAEWAAGRLADFPDIRYRTLDIERPASEQGFAGERFDLVLGANVVHATESLRITLRNLQSLLTPGGQLLLLESTGKRRLLDLIFGLTPGWWRFQDVELRPDHALLTPEAWERLLRSCHFVDVQAKPVYATEGYPTPCQTILCAQAVAAESIARAPDAPAGGRSNPPHTAPLAPPAASPPPAELPTANGGGDPSGGAAAATPALAAQLRSADSATRNRLLEQYLRETLGSIAKLNPATIDLDQPANNLGIDSMMAMQLRNRVQSELQIAIPVVLFLQGLSLRQLLEKLVEPLQSETPAPPQALLPTTESSTPRPEPVPTTIPEPPPSQAAPSQAAPSPDLPSQDPPWQKDPWQKDPPATERVFRSTSAAVPEVKIPVRTATEGADSDDGALSIGQQSLWAIHQLAPTSAAYNFGFLARALPASDVRGGTMHLDADRMQRACDRLLHVHPALRTHFPVVDGHARRRLADMETIRLREHDCEAWDEDTIADWLRDQADQPFDLASGPIIRFMLLRHRAGDLIGIVMHHIAADLWSMDMLVQQLCLLYADPGSRRLAIPATDFDEYVRWEHGLLRSAEGQRLWAFWESQLRDAATVLQLPTTYPRPARQTYNGKTFTWSLDPDLTASLRGLARREKTTLFTTLLSAYQAFLSRICNQDDLLVGSVVANRQESRWEPVVGYFLNQIVLRARFQTGTTFRDLLSQARAQMLDAMQHQAMPFAELVRRLGLPRDPSRAPLVQTMFIWDKPRHLENQEFRAADADVPALRLQPMLMEQRGAPFDLTLIVFELEQHLSLSLKYNTDLFSAEAITQLAESFNACLTTLVRRPDTPIAAAPLLSREAYQRQVIEANQTQLPHRPKTALQHFSDQVSANPDAPAIITTSTTWSYRELDQHAACLAGKLIDAGVDAEMRVGISLPRGPQAIAAILAAWKIGATYLPLDPEYPDARLRFMVDDAKPAVIVTQDIERFEVPGISPDVDAEALPAAWTDRLAADEVDRIAYMIYTSGSTGKPKAALLRHRGLSNLSAAQKQTFEVTADDRILQFASLNFDASIFEIVMALHHGAAICIPDLSEDQPISSSIVSQLRRLQVTIATLPPSILAAHRADDLPDLRVVVSAGEACTRRCLQNWAPGRRFFNAYGPTEATVWSTVHECTDDLQPPPIGRPIANTKAYVVDANLLPVPIGVPGELCVAGPGLAVGYHGRPALTADQFVPNPFSTDDDATMYRTGDLVRLRHDGEMEFLGRIDSQVKISGHRIEPDEIAATVAALPQIKAAVVVPRAVDSTHGRQHRLVAYYVPETMPGPDVSRLRTAVGERLPDFMVPAGWVPMDDLPLTPNGKMDLAALPETSDTRPALAAPFVAPETATEKVLAGIWEDVLQLDRVGTRDNFFDLGGASLQAVEAAEQAGLAGLKVPPEKMFQFQTIAELAAAIDTHDLPEDADEQATVTQLMEAGSIDEPWFASDTQASDTLASDTLASDTQASAVPASNAAAAPAAQPNDATGIAVAAQPADAVAPSITRTETTRTEVSGTEPATQTPTARRIDTTHPQMIVESLGTYVPSRVLSTAEVVAGCRKPLDFPLEKMSGIVARHVVAETEFSIDLAHQAARDCFAHSRYRPADIDLLVACNISRYDGPDFKIGYEPTTAAQLARRLGMPAAWTFDICNACAGFFTAMQLVRGLLTGGTVRRAMVVSGEYISHLMTTAQQEIDGFLDPRLACLTLGDAGAATILEMGDGTAGFEALQLYTAGKHHELCVAKLTDQPHGGAIMLTDAVQASAVTLKHSVAHAHRVLRDYRWKPESVDHLIMHQTSKTTLDGAVEELNRSFGREVCTPEMAVCNVVDRGNTASTTHWLAVMDQIRAGRIHTGDSAVFAISGSGQTVGTALYRFDDLPERIFAPEVGKAELPQDPLVEFGFDEPRVELVGLAIDRNPDRETVVDRARQAADSLLRSQRLDPSEIDLLLHGGIFREQYLSEPAVAAMVAGQLEINDDLPDPTGRRTLAFDMLDAGRGGLSVPLVAAKMIAAEDQHWALVTSSECENNAALGGPRRGVAVLGSAMLLKHTNRGCGFGAATMRRFDQHADLIVSHTHFAGGGTRLHIDQRPEAPRVLADCVRQTLVDWLPRQGLRIEDFAAILPPTVDPPFLAALAQGLGGSASQLVAPQENDGDPFTSSLALGWETLLERRRPAPGSKALLIGAGAGVEIACCIYHF